MPRFYFHIHDGRDLLDTDGIDLADEAAAQIEAVRLMGEVLRDDAARVIQSAAWSLDVADGAGRLVYRIDLRTSDGAHKTSKSTKHKGDLQQVL